MSGGEASRGLSFIQSARIAVKAEPLGVEITDDEADRWEAGLGHEFVYQHYKAVKQIRKSHARGSDHLLYQAMNDRKLWVRMEALLGLAELGVTMENSLVEKALREKRVYLLANYFRRFYDNPSASAVYIMKQALRDVKAPVRRVILENLWHLDDADTPLYLAAACYDPSSKVREWALSPPRNYSVTPFVLQRYQELVVIEWKKGSASQVAGQNGEAAEALPSFDEGDLIKNVTIAGIAVNDLPSLKKKPNAPPAPAVSAAPAPLENKEAVQDLVAPEEHKTEDGFDTLKAKDFEIKEDSAGK